MQKITGNSEYGINFQGQVILYPQLACCDLMTACVELGGGTNEYHLSQLQESSQHSLPQS